MDTDDAAFGRAVRGADSAAALLAIEAEHGRQGRFVALDALLGGLVVRLLRGEAVLAVAPLEQGRRRRFVARLGGLTVDERALIDEFFLVERQHGRGAWFLPDEASIKARLLDFPAQLARNGASAHNLLDIAGAERAVAPLGAAPDVVLVWAILQPLAEALYAPFTLRARVGGTDPLAKRLAAWQVIVADFADLGFVLDGPLAVLRPGAGWSRLRAEEQQAHLRALAADMAAQATPALGARFRAARLRPLLARYAAKARADGMVLRAQVVTRRFEPTLAGYFGGDWLAFLEYLGARPHPDEQIATALPEARLYLGAERSAAPTPAGIDETQLRLMLRALYGDADGASPVARRIAVLRRYWAAFDGLHAAQRPGLPPLWGLVAEGADVPRPDDTWSPYQDGLYERALPADLLRDIEECWGTAVLPARPGRIVGALSAHATLAEAFGPGLRFWHGCALTAWFLCAGPYSRTDMAGLAEYHRAELAAMAELGTPADPALFRQLIAAERQLGAPVPLREETTAVASEWGTLRMTMHTSFGQRRPGFERLRDIITAARRAWAAQHLEAYLRARAERDVGAAARRYQVRTVERGINPPTPKRFARDAAPIANRWFGGDLDALYRAIGEKPVVRPVHHRAMPSDRRACVRALYRVLGGTIEGDEIGVVAHRDAPGQQERLQANRQLADLAGRGLQYFQLEEGLGHAPDLAAFGQSWFATRAQALDTDIARAWERYAQAVEAVRYGPVGAVTYGTSQVVGAEPLACPTSITLPVESPPSADREVRERWWRRAIGAVRRRP